MDKVTVILPIICGIGSVISWFILVLYWFKLRSYAVSEGLDPYNMWKLFSLIWKDINHPMHRPLKIVLNCTILFFILGFLAILIGGPSKSTAKSAGKHAGIPIESAPSDAKLPA